MPGRPAQLHPPGVFTGEKYRGVFSPVAVDIPAAGRWPRGLPMVNMGTELGEHRDIRQSLIVLAFFPFFSLFRRKPSAVLP
jgi:hypothetical protein